MPIRQIGSLDVSLVGLGCNNFGGRTNESQSTEVVRAALDAGINFFDTADVYGGTRSEEILGAALGQDRADVIVATKFGMTVSPERTGAAPKYVKSALEDSLRRLGTDYVDLYQLHRPDPATPIGDTLAALAELVKDGKVREIGCSNFSAAQLREADAAAAEGAPRFVSVQNKYSLLEREPELEVLAECERLGTAFIPFSPLANGLLSGKYRRGASRLLLVRASPVCPPSAGRRCWRAPRWTSSNSWRASPSNRATASWSWLLPGWPPRRWWLRLLRGQPRPTRCGPTSGLLTGCSPKKNCKQSIASHRRQAPPAELGRITDGPTPGPGTQLRMGSAGALLSTSWIGLSRARRPSCSPTVPSATI